MEIEEMYKQEEGCLQRVGGGKNGSALKLPSVG